MDAVADILTLDQAIEDEQLKISLRPQSLDDFIGQGPMKARLRKFVEAAKIKGRLGHILLAGPPGLGKTSIGSLIAAEMDVDMRTVTGPNLRKPPELAAMLLEMDHGDILFVDEIHGINMAVQESLYAAMEDGKMDVLCGSGATARALTIPLPQFTLIGATTESGKLSKPLMDRFGLRLDMDLYETRDLTKIVVRAAASMDLTIDFEAAQSIARRGRGTPRICNELLRGVSDEALLIGDEGHITAHHAERYFEDEGIDSAGLNDKDRRYLRTVIEEFQCGPVGARNIADMLNESESNLRHTESYLTRLGFLVKVRTGRQVTMKAMQHMGYSTEEAGDTWLR